MSEAQHPIDYHFVFEQSQEKLCILNRDGLLLNANRRLRTEFGLAPTSFPQPLAPLVHPDDRTTAESALNRLTEENPTVEFEVRVRCRDNHYKPFLWKATNHPEQGIIDASVRNAISGRADARLFRSIAEIIHDLISISTMDRKIFYMNPYGMRLLGREGQDYRHLTSSDFVPPALMQFYANTIRPMLASEGRWSGETEFLLPDGSTIPVLQVLAVLRDEAGEPQYYVCLAHDLRPQKRLEQALRQAIRELSAPIIEVANGVLALPIIGMIDSARAAQITESLLHAIVKQRCRVAILDLTGVDTIDTGTLHHLFKMVSAASLLGSRCVVSGISAGAAQAMTQLGVDTTNLQTFRSLKEALSFAVRSERELSTRED